MKLEEYTELIRQGKEANFNPYEYFSDINMSSREYEDWCIKNTFA